MQRQTPQCSIVTDGGSRSTTYKGCLGTTDPVDSREYLEMFQIGLPWDTWDTGDTGDTGFTRDTGLIGVTGPILFKNF